jgi:2-haloacid dehalogenase
MEAYRRLALFPDVAATLERLRGLRLAILSNGSPSMLDPLVAHSGLDASIGDVLSVDAVKTYKPSPIVYQLAVDRLAMPASSIGFVSSNGWDACGAKAFGFTVFWINRTGAPVDALGVAPDHVIDSLARLPDLIGE